MPLLNSATHYGAITRFLHWAVFLLVAYQYLGANIMTRIASGKTVFWLNHIFDRDGFLYRMLLSIPVRRTASPAAACSQARV